MKRILIMIFLSLGLVGNLLCNSEDEREVESYEHESDIDRFVATELAEGLVNQENGLTKEIEDVSNVEEETSKQTMGIIDRRHTTTVTFTTEIDALTLFEWYDEEQYYKRYLKDGRTIDVSSIYYTGVIDSYEVILQLFSSQDGTGDGMQADQLFTLDDMVHSLKYERAVHAEIKTIWRDITRDATIQTSLTVTGLNDYIETFSVSGTRTSQVYVDRGRVTGDWTLTYEFDDVTCSSEIVVIDDVPVITTFYEGTTSATFVGTYTGPNGTLDINKTATITFNRERTVTITVNGETITVDVVTGDVE
ncbi:MAG: hypothetical protein SVZ03_03820 [Spirochaetota bacterium]|nr:hypothetical protein [Spirochaetota bacterium]